MFSKFKLQPSTVMGLGLLVGLAAYLAALFVLKDQQLALVIGVGLAGLTKISVADNTGMIPRLESLANTLVGLGQSGTLTPQLVVQDTVAAVVAAETGGGAGASLGESVAGVQTGAVAKAAGIIGGAISLSFVGLMLVACTPNAAQTVNAGLSAVAADAACAQIAAPGIEQAGATYSAGNAGAAGVQVVTALAAAGVTGPCRDAVAAAQALIKDLTATPATPATP